MDEGADHETEGREQRRRSGAADDGEGHGKVYDGGEDPEGDGFGERAAHDEAGEPYAHRRAVGGEPPFAGRRQRGAVMAPARFMREIKQRSRNQSNSGKSGRGPELAEHNIVGAEIEGRDDPARSNRLRDRLVDLESGEDRLRRCEGRRSLAWGAALASAALGQRPARRVSR
jgi:hypothetical protein